MIGPGKAFDTDKYFVICSNVLGGCRGTTGPASINPATGCPYAMSFPGHHHPRHGAAAEDARSITSASSGCWPSRAARWAACRRSNGPSPIPDAVAAAIPIATTARHSAQQIAFNEVGRQAIMADPDWNDGNYYGRQAAGPRARRRAHGRPHHLHERRVHAREVRPPPARARTSSASISPSISRSKATCATAAASSSTASTPTPTSTSPRRWTTST